MEMSYKMWSSLFVVLLSSYVCLAEEALSEDQINHRASGSRLRSRRMVGGMLAPLVPWQAMLYLGESVLDGGYAGGALISPRWIVTAGRNLFVKKSRDHTRNKEPTVPKVYLGIVGRPQADATTEIAVEKVFLHPGFQNQSDWDNDLALIQLKEAVVLGENVIPIPLPEWGQDLTDSQGASGIITGWGWGVYLTLAQSLKQLVVPVAKHSLCKAEFENSKNMPVVDDNMFCTGPSRYEENVCFGDAGGALAVQDPRDGSVYAAGILSYDKACREGYAVYMKLSAYLPWIHSVLRGDTQASAARRSAVMAKMFFRAGDSEEAPEQR